jgi:DNA-binding MarR family transcriptional regulator
MEPLKPSDDIWTPFALSIFHLNGLIVQAGDTISHAIGQSSARWQVLGSVHEPQTVAAIARHLGLARQGVQRVADVLEKEGLVRSTEHPTDRRTKLFALTPQGFEVMSEIYSRQLVWSQHVMTKLNHEQLIAVTAALQQIADVLETEVADPKKRRRTKTTTIDKPHP